MNETIIGVSTLVITLAVFIATIYRIKIEKKTIEIQYMNATALKKINAIKRTLVTEREEILGMSGKEFIKFLEEVCEDEN